MASGISIAGADRVFQPIGLLVLCSDGRPAPIEQPVSETGHSIEIESAQEINDVASRPFGLEHDVSKITSVGKVAHSISPEDKVAPCERAPLEVLAIERDIAVHERLPSDRFHSTSPESPTPTLTGRDTGGKSA